MDPVMFKKDEEQFISIPKDNSKIKLIVTLIISFLTFNGAIILILKDVFFPSLIPSPNFPDLSFNLASEYTVKNDEFDSQQEATFWLAKNLLRKKIIEELEQLSKNWVGYLIEFISEPEGSASSQKSNIIFLKKESSFEFLSLKEFSFLYRIIKNSKIRDDSGVVEKPKKYTYKGEIKLLISTNQLIKKLPVFNDALELPNSMVTTNDEFDSEQKETYFQGKNTLLNQLINYYQQRNKFDPNNLQTYFQKSLVGSEETDNNTNNSNITWEVDNKPIFTTLIVTKITFQLEIKVREQLIETNKAITYLKPINLIISMNKLGQKNNERWS